jgi:HK97 family phage portal protein
MKSTLRLLRNQSPVPLAPRSVQRLPLFGRNDATTQLQAFGQVSTLYAIVSRIGESVSQVDWRLYRRVSDARRRYGPAQQTETEVVSHAAVDLWQRPNAWMTRQEFVETTQKSLDLTGEGWWVIARDSRVDLPLELWPVRSDRMAPVPDPVKFIAGYVYSAPDGQQIPLGVNEVVQLKMPNPHDIYRGIGPVQSVLVDLDAAKYSAAWNRNFFLNSAEPGGVIQFPERLTDDEFNEFSDRWREQHQGVSAAHRVAILERGTWQSTGITQRDMQFVELRKVAREVIREAFGIHGHVLGLSDDINKANAQAGATSFGKWLVRPRLCRIREALNARLLPLYGTTAQGLAFDFDNPEPPDVESEALERDSRSAAFAALVGAGVDPDDAAALVGWPAVRMSPTPVPGDPAETTPVPA